jgi:phage terminase Nu1 subunit (DNA packaging protein)
MAEAQTATTRQIAQLLCRDERTIQRLAQRNILPKARNPDGTPRRDSYEIIPTVRAFIMYLDDQLARADLADDAYRLERTALVRAQRERQELENQLFRGELHRADDVEAIMNDLLTGIKMRLLAIPTRVARLLVGQHQIPRIIEILTDAVELALGDVLNYRAEDFYSRNSEYLRARGIEAADLLVSTPSGNGDASSSSQSDY